MAGTLLYATTTAWAGDTGDDPCWVRHKGRLAVDGRKALIEADAAMALVERRLLTQARIDVGRAGLDALSDDPAKLFATASIAAPTSAVAIRAQGGSARVAAHATWGRDEQGTRARVDARQIDPSRVPMI